MEILTKRGRRQTSLLYHGQRKDTQLLGFKDREMLVEGHNLRKPWDWLKNLLS